MGQVLRWKPTHVIGSDRLPHKEDKEKNFAELPLQGLEGATVARWKIGRRR